MVREWEMSGMLLWKQMRTGAGWLAGMIILTHCGGVGEIGEGSQGTAEDPAQQTAALDNCEPRVGYEDIEVRGLQDTYVVAAQPGATYGGASTLLVDGDPRMEAYLRFTLSPSDLQGGSITRVRLQLYATDGSTDGPAIYRTATDWNPATLTWNTRPARTSEALGDLGEVITFTRVEYDVSQVVTGPGTYSFALVPTGGNGVDFRATEYGLTGQVPQLTLTVARTYCTRRGTGGDVTWAWTRGGQGHQWVEDAMAVGADGGFVVATTYSPSGNFGGQTFTTPHNFALVKYAPDGTHQWSRAYVPFVSGSNVQVNDLALTPLGNVLVVGMYRGAPDFGAGPLPATPDEDSWGLFIAKYSPSGGFVWARGFLASGSAGEDVSVSTRAVATDANGSLIVTGGFVGRLNLGGETLTSGDTFTQYGMFLAKFSWEGAHLWSRAVPAGTSGPWNASTAGEDVLTDAEGRIFVGGSAGTGRLGATADSTPFVAAYSPEGTPRWSRALNGADGPVRSLALMPGGAVAFSGFFSGTFTFAGTTLSSPPDSRGQLRQDGFLGVLSSTGSDTWARRFGSAVADEYLGHIATDASGNISVLANGWAPMDLGGGVLGSPTGFNTFVARFSPTGTHRWSRELDPNLTVRTVKASPDGGTLVPGSFMDPVTVNGQQYTPPGEGGELLFLRFAP